MKVVEDMKSVERRVFQSPLAINLSNCSKKSTTNHFFSKIEGGYETL
jgi:hypothetical protein